MKSSKRHCKHVSNRHHPQGSAPAAAAAAAAGAAAAAAAGAAGARRLQHLVASRRARGRRRGLPLLERGLYAGRAALPRRDRHGVGRAALDAGHSGRDALGQRPVRRCALALRQRRVRRLRRAGRWRGHGRDGGESLLCGQPHCRSHRRQRRGRHKHAALIGQLQRPLQGRLLARRLGLLGRGQQHDGLRLLRGLRQLRQHHRLSGRAVRPQGRPLHGLHGRRLARASALLHAHAQQLWFHRPASAENAERAVDDIRQNDCRGRGLGPVDFWIPVLLFADADERRADKVLGH